MRKISKKFINRMALIVGGCSLVVTPVAIIISCCLNPKAITPDEIDKWAYLKYRPWYENLSNEEAQMMQLFTLDDAPGQLWNVFLQKSDEQTLKKLAESGVKDIKTDEYIPCIGNKSIPTLGYQLIDQALNRNIVGYYDDLNKDPIVVYHSFDFYETNILNQIMSNLKIDSLKDYDLSKITDLRTYRLIDTEIQSYGWLKGSLDKRYELKEETMREWNSQIDTPWNICPVFEIELNPEITGAYLSLPQIKRNDNLLAPHDQHTFVVNRDATLKVKSAELIRKEDKNGIYYQLYIKCFAFNNKKI